MKNWDDLRFLVALARTGTMTAAAQMLGTNTATVSRRIERLSETLGAPAFVKTADGWKPSDAVASLIQVAQSFDGQLQSAINSQAVESQADAITISVGCPPIVRSQVLYPGLQRHSDMLDGIKLTIADRILKEGLGENDLVITLNRPDQGRIVTRKAGALSFRLYQFHDGDRSGDWAGLGEVHDDQRIISAAMAHFGREPRLRVDSIMALYGLMTVTRLPGPLPDIVAAQDDRLEPINPEEPPFVYENWLYYHESRRSDTGMRRAVDWVIRSFEDAGCSSSAPARVG